MKGWSGTAAMLPPAVTLVKVPRAPVWMEEAPGPDATPESARRGRRRPQQSLSQWRVPSRS